MAVKTSRHYTRILCAWLVVVTAGQATAGQSADSNDFLHLEELLKLIPLPPKNSTFTVYWENDGTFLKPIGRSDRHYTDGIRLVYTHQPDWNWLKDFSRWNNFADGNEADTAMGYFFGQNMYTPDHADAPSKRGKHDRVFAARIYGGVFAQRAKKDEMEHFELSMGVIGPSALGGELPEGLPFGQTPEFDSYLEYGFRAGSVFRNANLGLIFRLGENLPNDFGPGRLEAPYCATGPIGEKHSYLYFFGRASVKFVQYDRFLTGLDAEPFVGQFQVGVVWRYKSFQVSYSQTFLTREYKEQPDTDSYAALNLSYRF